MKLKKKHKIALGILTSILLILFISNAIISNLISRKVVELLEKQHLEHFIISIDHSKFGILDRSVVFREVLLSPTDSSMAKLKHNVLHKNALPKLSISRVKLKGIHLTSLLLSRNLIINKIIIDDPLYQHFTNDELPPPQKTEKPLRPDSIYLENMNGFKLDMIIVSNLKVQMIDVIENKVTFENKPLNFEITGIELDKVSDHTFKITSIKESFDISNINVELPNVKYKFSIDALKYFYQDNYFEVSDITFKPMINKLTLANSYTFNKDVNSIGIDKVMLFNLNIDKLIQNKGIFMDSMHVKGANFDIYKDKRKPFDLKRRPKFPQEQLKQMKTPLLIPKVSILDSYLKYEENLDDKDLLMNVTMNEFNANIFNVTSIEEFRKVPLKIDIATILMGKGNLHIDMLIPLEDGDPPFYFSGHLGKSKLSYYERAIIPALGLKVLSGNVESLSFQASANSVNAGGTMNFAYNDLEAEVFKKNDNEKNRFLSWSVNSLIHKSNPGNNGDFREAIMKHERVLYKGFWNFIWKTIQSGIVNSIAPFGKTSEKVEAKKKRQKQREIRKKKREE